MLFQKNKEQSIHKNWKILSHNDQVSSIIEQSYRKPQVIFKHSTRCGISLQVLNDLQTEWVLSENEVDFYYLDLLNNREVSQNVSEKLNIPHQSPQIIIIKNGKSIQNYSHYSISYQKILQNLPS